MGQSITGGVMYRGKELQAQLAGNYVFADYEVGTLASIYYDVTKQTWVDRVLAGPEHGVDRMSTFAEDAHGEVFLVSIGTTRNIYK